ncbi:DUF2927 domain-containing protein [Loktanella sp. M215]|uniref:DUF2927 domain-containing protein n=1 Tax=Loktanella sp. M215 TaxID=2675431 RepID=UPI001F447BE2|nr:DUF2927 domain-containing protein [Loktanella sp. M215]MCF7700454.1 DUF2927 domain-containing protein [Loktanella sp. M215]
MNRVSALVVAACLASCAPAPVATPPTRAATNSNSLPAMRGFADTTVVPVTRSNPEMAQDFLDLTFRLESGRALPAMTRFEGPITVRVAPGAPATLTPDLDALLARLRSEAGIEITRVSGPANITVEAVPQKALQRAVPQAACFTVPRVRDWPEYLKMRKSPAVDWSTLTVRDTATIFIPGDAAPQEIRDCLHEELAQSLGPLNDLYRLPDSVFNDDNIHAVLTGFDMLMLRAIYAPEMHNGMSRHDAAEVIGPLLARLNPRGERSGYGVFPDTSRDWITAIETALTSGSSPAARRDAVIRAVRIAHQFRWGGPREGFSYYALGRLQVGYDSAAALAAFDTADAIYSASPLMEIHAAHIAVQKAAFSLSAGDAMTTIRLADQAIPVAARHQNAALMATLMMFKAEALDMQGNKIAAEAVRVDSLGWARYGFGSDDNVRARMAEVKGLRPY